MFSAVLIEKGEAGQTVGLTDLDEAQLPRHVLFFCEDEVAVSGNAKIKAGALRELAAKRPAGN
jgi:hypothetical protein